MLQRAVNFLRGHVTVQVESGFPERVINLCAARQIPFWDLVWESPLTFTFTMTKESFQRLRAISERLDANMKVTHRQGLPFFTSWLLKRHVLAAGLLLSLVLTAVGSFFIWDFEIQGNRRVSDAEILRALQDCGVTIGTFAYGIRSDELRNEILLDLPELSYLAVNVKGSRAYVQVRERVETPEMISKEVKGNTIAVRDGLVTEMKPYDGQRMVLPGTMVTKGQMLISGVVDHEQTGTRFLRGMGEVYARTWYDLPCKTTATMEKKTYTEKTTTRLSLCWGKNKIKIFPGSSIPPQSCDKITRRTQLTLPGGILLPITLVTETYTYYTLAEEQRQEEDAKAAAYDVLKQYMLTGMEEGEVLSENCAAVTVGGVILTQLDAECQEQIGRFVEIPTNFEDTKEIS